jgi:hypothetical protein
MSICELCYRDCPMIDGQVPKCWDIVFQSLICPECCEKARLHKKRVAHMRGGEYAVRKDPRTTKAEKAEVPANMI